MLVHDRLGKELVHYLTPMMTGVEHEDDIGVSLEDTGLPPTQATEALIDGLSQHSEISFRLANY